MKRLAFALVALVLVCGSSHAIPILAPGDAIIAIDTDPLASHSSYPGGENPTLILDGNPGTKYLNFGGNFTGFIVTPSAPTQVQSFVMATANDAEGRDPKVWKLYGTNDPITSTDNSTGLAENWVLVDSGTVALPAARVTVGPVVTVNNAATYASYKMVVEQTKGAAIMQVGDVLMYASTDGSGASVVAPGNPIIAVQAAPDSRYPANEAPANIIDNSLAKYLNFGKTNSGFIVTPSIGSSIIDSFQITTANDAVERDPLSWEIYGTNDAIATEDNGQGDAEIWALIASGLVFLPEERDTPGPIISFANGDAYTSYKMIFPLVKNADAANSMQIAEVQFFGVPEPATIALLGLGAISLLRKRRA